MRPVIAEHVPQATCPRCAYDLSGTVARWTAACDLHGTCPECGLEFQWGDILNPERAVPRWFYEAARGRPALLLVRTAARALRPRRFWSAVNLAFRVRTRRLVVLCVVMLALSHAIVAAASAAMLRFQLLEVRTFAPSLQLDSSEATMYATACLWPYTRTTFDATVTYVSPGSAGVAPSTTTYPARFEVGGEIGGHLLTPAVAIALLPLTYLLLRQTLRRTRVRRAHLLRIGAYSMLALPLFVTMHLAVWPPLRERVWGWRNRTSRSMDTIDAIIMRLYALDQAVQLPLLVLAAQLLLLGMWWYAATTRYLRLPHAAGVVLAMVVITTLLVLGFLVFTDAWQMYLNV